MIFGARSGKTVQLVLKAAGRQGIIIVSSQARALFLKNLARDLGVSIPEPVVHKPKRRKIEGMTFDLVLVDEWRIKEE